MENIYVIPAEDYLSLLEMRKVIQDLDAKSFGKEKFDLEKPIKLLREGLDNAEEVSFTEINKDRYDN